MTPGRIVAILALAGAVAFAVHGGEYSTLDLVKLKRDGADEQRLVVDLRRTVDSLERAATAIERDPKVQERAARESFGMIRHGEYLYRIVPGDSSAGTGDSAGH